MKSYIEKREVLCSLAELYLDTKDDNYISINDGMMNSSDFDSISFLMLMALTDSKQDETNVYSIDFEVSEEIRNSFVEKEYAKIIKSKEDKVILGQRILQDAKNLYISLYDKDSDIDFDEIGRKFFL